MLVLQRKDREGFVIDPDGLNIEVVYLGYRNGQARIGVSAPRDILVLRKEILEFTRPISEAR